MLTLSIFLLVLTLTPEIVTCFNRNPLRQGALCIRMRELNLNSINTVSNEYSNNIQFNDESFSNRSPKMSDEEEPKPAEDDDDEEEESSSESSSDVVVESDSSPQISLLKQGLNISTNLNGSDVRVGIIMARWNADIIQGLYKVNTCFSHHFI